MTAETEQAPANDAAVSGVELIAKRIAAHKMGLQHDPYGTNLPDDLWHQAVPLARSIIAADLAERAEVLMAYIAKLPASYGLSSMEARHVAEGWIAADPATAQLANAREVLAEMDKLVDGLRAQLSESGTMAEKMGEFAQKQHEQLAALQAECASIMASCSAWADRCRYLGNENARLRASLSEILPWHDSHPAEPTDSEMVLRARQALAARPVEGGS